MGAPITVSPEVFNGILHARDSDNVNMLDRERLIDYLTALHCDDTARWIADNWEEYCRGIFNGFQTEEEDE